MRRNFLLQLKLNKIKNKIKHKYCEKFVKLSKEYDLCYLKNFLLHFTFCIIIQTRQPLKIKFKRLSKSKVKSFLISMR